LPGRGIRSRWKAHQACRGKVEQKGDGRKDLGSGVSKGSIRCRPPKAGIVALATLPMEDVPIEEQKNRVMKKPKEFPQQQQSQPGDQHKMRPEPEIIREGYKGSDKLLGKKALISGGDSGIGRSVAV